MRHSYLAANCILLILVVGCQTPKYTNVESGDRQTFIQGVPNFTFGTYATFDENQEPGLDMFLAIPSGNLIYAQNEDEGYSAGFDALLLIESKEKDNFFQKTVSLTRSLKAATYEETLESKEILLQQSIQLQPGPYSIQVVVTDSNTKKNALKRFSVVIPDPQSTAFTIGSIRLQKVTNSNQISPLLTYQVGNMFDSLRIETELLLNSEVLKTDQISLQLNVIRFQTDSSFARPPHFVTPSRASLEFKGINFKKVDTMYTLAIELEKGKSRFFLSTGIGRLPKGNYRVELEGVIEDEEKKELYQGRDFVVQSEHYPSIKTLDELIETTAYITYEKEFKRLTQATTVIEKRKAFESFWASLFSNANEAQRVLNRYYERVEEANRLFSTFKEGWKTDMGMIYILYGPPMYVEQGIEGFVWYYSSSQMDNSRIFQFREVRNQSGYFPYQHFVLLRGLTYERSYMEVFERWRSGRI